jgi:hypothetical protein
MQPETAHKLIQLAQAAPTVPKKGTPPKNKKNEEFYRFMALVCLPRLGALLYRNYKLDSNACYRSPVGTQFNA